MFWDGRSLEGGFWYNSWHGDFQANKELGNIFMIWVALKMESPQNLDGKLDSIMSDLATSSKYLCFLSTSPFCWGVYGQVYWCRMPSFWRRTVVSWFTNSVPLSVLTAYTILENWVWIIWKNCSKIEFTWNLFCKRNVQVAWLKSATTVKT